MFAATVTTRSRISKLDDSPVATLSSSQPEDGFDLGSNSFVYAAGR
jgi:hypothetical protein